MDLSETNEPNQNKEWAHFPSIASLLWQRAYCNPQEERLSGRGLLYGQCL